MPLTPCSAFQGSAATIGVLDVPRVKCGVKISAVAVSIENAVGAVHTVAAVSERGLWSATFSAEHFANAGRTENGLTVVASGEDENGYERCWVLGKGDWRILPADGIPQPAETLYAVRIVETQDNPHEGNLYKAEGGWKIYHDGAWVDFGGGAGGTSDYNDLTNKPKIGGVELTGDKSLSEIGAVGIDVENTVTDGFSFNKPNGDSLLINPDSDWVLFGYSIGFFDRSAYEYHPWTDFALKSQLSAKQDALNDTQLGVINNGPYRTTSWTPTAAEVGAATEAQAKYPITATTGALLDRTINTATGGGSFTFPASAGYARDFVLVIAASSTTPSVSFPATGVSYYSDDDSVWTAAADCVNAWYFSEIGENQFMVAHKALKSSTQS